MKRRKQLVGGFRQNSFQAIQTEPMGILDYETAGIPLPDAAWYFAGRKLWKNHRDAKTASKQLMDKCHERAKAIAPDADCVTLLDAACETLHAIFDFDAPVKDVMAAMWDQLYGGVWSGKLVAIGFAMPRKAGDQPVKIPNDVFQRCYVNSAKAEAKGAGLHFVSVRIVEANDYSQQRRRALLLSAPESAVSEDSPKRGRRSAKEAVCSAFENLTAADRINVTAPLRGANAAAINRFITEDNLWHKELNYETIRRHISKEFNAVRQNTKQ